MKPITKKRLRLILTVLVIIALFWYARGGQSAGNTPNVADSQGVLTLVTDNGGSTDTPETPDAAAELDEDGQYSQKDDLALYIHTYGHLPDNFVSKAQARDKGWSGGSLENYFPNCSIGGDKFGNREGLLPAKDGRQYYECDVDTMGRAERGAKRIVFSNDGLVYYTDDHYESFTLLYGEA